MSPAASEWESERASERCERTSERCERTSEWMSEWPITYVPILRNSESLCKVSKWASEMSECLSDASKRASRRAAYNLSIVRCSNDCDKDFSLSLSIRSIYMKMENSNKMRKDTYTNNKASKKLKPGPSNQCIPLSLALLICERPLLYKASDHHSVRLVAQLHAPSSIIDKWIDEWVVSIFYIIQYFSQHSWLYWATLKTVQDHCV